MQRPASPSPQSELSAALGACRSALIAIALFSAVSNILMLTGSFFMLEVYDRVLPSRSVPTLVGLVRPRRRPLHIAQGVLDLIRGAHPGPHRRRARRGAQRPRVTKRVVRLPLMVGSRNDGLQPLRDLDNVRSFLSGIGPTAFFDLPWLPLYLAICFAFHPWIGLTALVGAIILVALTCSPRS